MLFHEAISRSLADHGVDTMFGLMGDGNLFLVDSYVRETGGKFVSVAMEAGAVLAAGGYAHTSGKLGVCTVTHGPAFTNTLTALVDATNAMSPILLIAGDTATTDLNNIQNVDQAEFVRPTGAGFVQVRSAATYAEDLANAIRRVWAERRPIVLNIPVEFQWQEVDYVTATPVVYPSLPSGPAPDLVETAVGIIASAKRPLVLAGKGATSPEARAALLALAARLGAPVATSLKARDLFRGEKFNLGVFGNVATPVASDAITGADVIISFGARLTGYTTDQGSLIANAQVIQVDTDARALGRYQAPDVAILGDSAATAAALLALVEEAELPTTGFASEELAARIAAYDPSDFRDLSTDTTIDIRTAILRIEESFPVERTMIYDGGRFIGSAFPMFHSPDPRGFMHTANFGSIGLGMGTAIGAAVGDPSRPVLHITGDGGFMLGGVAEFLNAVRQGIDMVVIVFNDGAYGAEHIQFTSRDMDPSLSTFEWPEFGPIATAMGAQGFTVRNLAELDEALAAIPGRTTPIFIDVIISPFDVPSLRH